MNTRLNMSVRERKGLAYSIEAAYTPFSDIGLFTIFFGCDPRHKDHCIDLIYKELKNIREQKLGSMQLFYAQKQFIGQLALSNETKLNEMLSIGHAALFFEDVDTMEESIAEIHQITSSEILDVANEVLQPDLFCTLVFEPAI